jgi:hypothetical protein
MRSSQPHRWQCRQPPAAMRCTHAPAVAAVIARPSASFKRRWRTEGWKRRLAGAVSEALGSRRPCLSSFGIFRPRARRFPGRRPRNCRTSVAAPEPVVPDRVASAHALAALLRQAGVLRRLDVLETPGRDTSSPMAKALTAPGPGRSPEQGAACRVSTGG